ncbi:hypothetical protein [Halobacillus sp. Marseille-Q1614]|uniref:hypothetical protein n=1 Tax=Halobacillus sp. Marseille-Q1614 TaxID=2709134 RepID=UPI001570672C|nr:hypothetical protein [Halobacillus sp. Marseille-Q1614]
MAKEPKKKFKIPTEADTTGQVGMQNTVKSGKPLDAEDQLSGDSVDELNQLEAFNEDQAIKEIGQVYNNS